MNELLKNELLKNSRAVEIFLTEDNPKVFDQRRKELRSLLQTPLLRSIIGKKPSDSDKKINLLSFPKKYIEMKMSSQVSKSLEIAENKFKGYEQILSKLLAVFKDYLKYQTKMRSIND